MLGAAARSRSRTTSVRNREELHEISVAGERLVLHPGGILWWEAQRTLVVSDLHFEKASSFARRGVFLPPYDTAVTLDRLSAYIHGLEPKRVISLGDSFHDPDGAARMPLDLQTQLAMLQIGREWIWITGNHDPHGSAGRFGDHVEEHVIAGLTFRHEPREDAVEGEIAGHLHPVGRIRRHGRSVRRACFAGNLSRLVMPAFGALTGGLNVLDGPWREIFPTGDFTAYLMGEQRIYPISAYKLRPD